MDDEAGIIYGIEYPARALCAQPAENDIKRFLIGTQSLKYDNQIHLVEYDDDSNTITKCVCDHKDGEIWHIASSPNINSQFLTCYNKISPNNVAMKCSIWQFPGQMEPSLANDDSSHYSLIKVADLPSDSSICAIWYPNSGNLGSNSSNSNYIVSLSETCIYYYDLNIAAPTLIASANLEAKGQPKFTNCKWNLHHNFTQIATCNDSAIRGWDLKSMKQTYVIENAHGQMVRDIDFNPNKQYYMVSCGDDGKTKFWDIRKTSESLKTLVNHSHWVWCARYNTFHDQLVLTCSSDNKVVLSSVSSLSSEPFKQVISDDLNDSAPNGKPTQVAEPDKLVKVYEDHEDSVYACEWSTIDPWVFASLSFDGRLVINKVPKEEKYKILL